MERLFIHSGYVLDFTNLTFRQFFVDDVDVDIDDPKYEKNGTSKGNRLRTFLEVEGNETVARAIRALWEYRKAMSPDLECDADEAQITAFIKSLSPSEVAPATPAPLAAGTAPINPSPISRPSETSAVVTAFASYAQSGSEYRQRVLEAVQRLRRDGIDCYSDHFNPFPKEGWPEWMRRQLKRARWILVFASEAYKRRAEGEEQPGRGLGVIWEHGEIRRELYDAGRINERFVPVGFGADRTNVPSILSEYSYFNLDSPEDYGNLLGVLKGKPLHTPEPLGSATGTTQATSVREGASAPQMDVAPASTPGKRKIVRSVSSTAFFSDRFTQAFPGVRGMAHFTQPDANKRLVILLKPPLCISDGDHGSIEPIWIWRRGDLGIHRFELRADGTALLNVEELEIEEVVAVNSGIYYQQFVYVRTRASAPTGLYPDYDPSEIVALRGDATEEFGLYNGHYITRAEYDDGAAVIDGEPVDARDSAELRVRYITPSNFVLAAQGSPIDNTAFDRRRQELLNGILRGQNTVDDLAAAIFELPKRDGLRYE